MADAAKSGFPFWRAGAFGIGLTSLLTGVALMESGIDAGRILLTVGLPIAALGLIALAVPRRPPPAPPIDSAERRLSAVLARVGTHIGLDIEADRLVFWTKGDSAELINKLKAPTGETSNSMEFYLSGNVEIRAPKGGRIARLGTGQCLSGMGKGKPAPLSPSREELQKYLAEVTLD